MSLDLLCLLYYSFKEPCTLYYYPTTINRAVRLSTRNNVKPTPYTPYNYEGYQLNKKKALDKKVQQCNRSADMELQYEHGNYVLEMSLAAYELLKGAIK